MDDVTETLRRRVLTTRHSRECDLHGRVCSNTIPAELVRSLAFQRVLYSADVVSHLACRLVRFAFALKLAVAMRPSSVA